MRTLLTALVIAATAALGVGAASACGDDWMPENLVLTPQVKGALRSAFLAAHPDVSPASVGAPVSGRTYYGRYSGTSYAVATFRVGGTPAYPTVFRTDGNARWHLRRETHGGVCSDVVPVELIKTWSLQHWGGRCYVLPR